MTYTAIDTFYPPAEQLRDSPSRRDGVDEPAEASLRAYGCQLVQEAGILLRVSSSTASPASSRSPGSASRESRRRASGYRRSWRRAPGDWRASSACSIGSNAGGTA
ncbi:uncharacterized protein [Lolium perenne]|uniref:uncharacterized protein n=1 Tax=Lolium perenne TaxID=4522 RepID=UPI0021F56E2F|nr:cyclin-L1-1-like [Lolium perenne]